MKALVQRVKNASVVVENKPHSQIGFGILVLLGVEKSDEAENANKLAEKLLNLRIFEDNDGKMNKSISEIKGEILVVSQFTLLGDCKKGTRPSFDKAAPPDQAERLYEDFVKKISESNLTVKTGKFQAMMDVSLINNGPVTFLVEK